MPFLFNIKLKQMNEKINVFGIIIISVILVDFFEFIYLSKPIKGFLYLFMFFVFSYKIYISYFKNKQ